LPDPRNPRTQHDTGPWVNILDGQTIGPEIHTSQSGERHQDKSSNPATGRYSTQGKVGLFADKDDNGVYDQLDPDRKYQGPQAIETGAYPMLWDIPVEADASSIDTSAGCDVDGIPFGEVARNAGYGPNTALVQALYLKEPTTFVSQETGEVVPYLDGDSIFVLSSSAGHTLWRPGDSQSSDPLAQEIDHLVTELRDFVIHEHDTDPGDLDVHMPGHSVHHGSDF